MYKYITNYVFKLFSLGHLIQIESDSFIWILDLGWARTPPFISTEERASRDNVSFGSLDRTRIINPSASV